MLELLEPLLAVPVDLRDALLQYFLDLLLLHE